MTKTTINLAALKAARLEAAGEAIEFVWDDQTFTTSPEIPLAVLSLLRQGDIEGAAHALLGEEQAARFLTLPGVSIQDFSALVEAVTEKTTGASVGEASGSSRS